MTRNIIIKTAFEATHSYSQCAIPEVLFLRHEHRHTFYVTIKFNVSHNDRDIEFIKKKQEINRYILDNFSNKFLQDMSCEDMAENLLLNFKASFVSVFEDDENGAEIYI